GPRRARRAAPAPGRLRPRGRRPVWLLHAGDLDERLGAAGEEPAAEPGRDRAGAVGEPVPLHRLHQDLRRGRAGGGADGGRAMSRRPAGNSGPDPSLAGNTPASAPGSPDPAAPGARPAARMMPAERRLEPPRWPGGRARSPGREFNVIGKRNRKVEGLAKVTG